MFDFNDLDSAMNLLAILWDKPDYPSFETLYYHFALAEYYSKSSKDAKP